MSLIDVLIAEARRLYEATRRPESITTGTLIRGTETHPQYLVNTLQERYNQRQKEITDQYGIRPPLIALLREEVIGDIPFLKERSKWKNFQPSDSDWARYIRLPFEITSEVAQLLGIERAAFTIIKSGNHYGLEQTLSTRDEVFFRSYVLPRIRRVHNLQIGSTNRIRIASEAIVTWETEDLGFPSFSYFSTLPEDIQYSFLEGLLAGQGFRVRNRSLRIFKAGDNSDYIPQLERLAIGLGFRPTVSKGGEYMIFSNSDLNRISLINPRHQR